MFGLENIRLSLNGSFWLYLLYGIILTAFSFFVYRYTLPKISGMLKFSLTILRALIFALILFLIFEPLLSLTSRSYTKKNTFVFIDNSESISIKDSLQRSKAILSLAAKLISRTELNVKMYSFGKRIDSVSAHNPKFTFSEQLTNYSSFIDFFKKNDAAIQSAVIISDGIITEGSNPSYYFEKLQFPIFTVGVGDSTTKKDVEIFRVNHNQFIYTGTQTKIQTVIRQNGFDGKQIQANLFEEGKLIDSKEIQLNSSGVNQFDFSYLPKEGGEKKLSISISPLLDEHTQVNNSKTFFVTVLETKAKLALIAGAPSADVSAIANIIESDRNLQVSKYVQISRERIWDSKNVNALDSSSVMFLVDFPSANTSQQLINQVVSKIEAGTPFFISVSSATDFGKLKQLEKFLPFYVKSFTQDVVQAQAEIQTGEFASNFSQIGNAANVWNALPPVFQSTSEILAKPESKVLVKAKVREAILNSPLVLLRSIGSQRSFAINAGNYWRWSLQAAERNPEFFRTFITEIVKWLNLPGTKKQFNISPNKKVYSPGEQVDLTAEVYDNSFNPIDTTQIELSISHARGKQEIVMTPQGSGIYTASFIPDSQGDFQVTASTTSSSSTAATRFSITSSSIELIDTKMRVEYLKHLANSTNGEYFSIEKADELLKHLEFTHKKKDSAVIVKSEYELWNYSWVLITIILLFAAEWFWRKRLGMI
ncbi:MAG: hypothetical protein FD143_1683 [Ignavibacteria bacterium]|nr:MAG: hypothetical protein FD143_1683 [Ignavibacteria bacterium]KAF0161728.1 MAG: hypothetical protein FD188_533 [Ignavibacteria bacterium]